MAELGQLAQRLEQLAQLVTACAPAAPALRLVVLQPTPYCNLDCAYCYLPGRDDRRRMRPETLDAIGRNVLASPLAADPLSVVWHAGEPMTLPPDWYEDAFARLARAAPGRTLRHGFQTNAIGVDAAWIGLWRRWDVSVGVSLDGPAALHDARRRTRRGRGSHALTMRGIARLQEAGLPFHVIAVLGADSLRDPDALLDFFEAAGIRDVAFNVEEEEGAHRASSLRGAEIERLHRRFLRRLFARTSGPRAALRCRETQGFRAMLAAPAERRADNDQTTPLAIVSIAVDGGMSSFSPEFLGLPAPDFGNFVFGDVHREGPEAMQAHPAFRRLAAEIAGGVAACAADCAYFGVCGGGAPVNKFAEHGHCRGTATLYCRLTLQAVVDEGLAWIEGGGDAAAA